MADDVFKLPQSSYETVCRIVQAYAQVGDKTSLSTVSKILGTDTTVVSRNIAFLVSVGLLEGGRDKGPTPAGAKLGRALEFNEGDDIASAWRDVLTGHPLIQRILSAIRVRGGMDPSTLQTQIVYTAGVNKTSGTMTGGGAVLEMMKAANLIVERDGRFIAQTLTEPAAPSDEAADENEAHGTSLPTAVVQRVLETRDESGISVRIELNIQVTANAEDLPSVGVGIRQMLAEIRERELTLEDQDPVVDEPA